MGSNILCVYYKPCKCVYLRLYQIYVTQPQIYTFTWFVIHTKNITPHNVIKHLFSQEANKIQLEMINGHYRI